jgi:peroxin-5
MCVYLFCKCFFYFVFAPARPRPPHALASASPSDRSYAFAADNPFLADADPAAAGRRLFRAGVLSEAALALEAAVQRAPGDAAAWRLLGTVQAENDDDAAAIAAWNRALAIDPGDLEALLSLGVAHTNELEAAPAVRHLREWLARHPAHGAAAAAAPSPADASQAAAAACAAFAAAAAAAPGEPDVLAALGVLSNLARRYDDAEAAFRAALALRPGDYSLWNKVGCTALALLVCTGRLFI